VDATLADMSASEAEPGAELRRMLRLADAYAKLPAGASVRLCNACEEARPPEALLVNASADRTDMLPVLLLHVHLALLPCGLGKVICIVWSNSLFLACHNRRVSSSLQVGAALQCHHCDRAFHALCLATPVLEVEDLEPGADWHCACCSKANTVCMRVC